LLAQIGRGIDQKPVVPVGTDCDGGLGALKFSVPGSRGLTHLAAAIPLRDATTCRGAQDDDAKHDPSPENLKPVTLDKNSARPIQPRN
jgi:hypothetical protein